MQSHLWQALNLYDDIQDGDCGLEKLWAANRHYRYFFSALCQLGLKPSFYQLSDQLFMQLEETNKREHLTNRACSQKHLADKSLPLCLGPLAALQLMEEKRGNKRLAALELFRQALGAKQLSDDCRDWQEDWESKHLTLANRPLAANNHRLGGKGEETRKNLLFFRRSAVLTNMILMKLEKARSEGKKLGLNERSPIIRCLIFPLEKAAREAQGWQKAFSGRKTAAML